MRLLRWRYRARHAAGKAPPIEVDPTRSGVHGSFLRVVREGVKHLGILQAGGRNGDETVQRARIQSVQSSPRTLPSSANATNAVSAKAW